MLFNSNNLKLKKMKQRRRTFMVDDKTWKEVTLLADKYKTSNSTIIRQAISDKIKKEKK